MDFLLPGMVFHLLFKDAKPEPKNKFFVTIWSEKPEALFFLINSCIHPMLQKNQYMSERQVVIDVASHPFLDRDSYIDCTTPTSLCFEEIDFQEGRGCISEDVKGKVIFAVEDSPLIEPIKQRLILDYLSG